MQRFALRSSCRKALPVRKSSAHSLWRARIFFNSPSVSLMPLYSLLQTALEILLPELANNKPANNRPVNSIISEAKNHFLRVSITSNPLSSTITLFPFLFSYITFFSNFFGCACNEQITSLETLCVSLRYGWQGAVRLFFPIGIFHAVAALPASL